MPSPTHSPIARLLRLALAAVLVLTPVTTTSARSLQVGTSASPAIEVIAPATLNVWNREIVTFRAPLEGVQPAERVERARLRIADLPASALAASVEIAPTSIAGVTGRTVTIGGELAFRLLPQDADAERGETLDQQADESARRLQTALRARAEQMQPKVLLRGILLAALASLVLGAAIWLLVRARRAALARLERAFTGRRFLVAGVDVAPFVVTIVRGTTRLAAFAAGGIAAYLWLTFVLVQFPFTEPWGLGLGVFLLAELRVVGTAILSEAPKLFTLFLIFVSTRVVVRLIHTFFANVERGRVHVSWLERDSAKATRRILIGLAWLFAIVVAYPYLPGSGSEAFKGVSVFAGLMITLGSSGLVGQLMSGFVLIYARALRAGEYVRIGDVEGTVLVVGVLSTKLRTLKHEEVTIPNAVVVGGKVVNYSRLSQPTGAVASTTVTIGYDAPWRQVHALLVDAARRTDGVRADPAPFVLQRALSDFYVEYELRVHFAEPDRRPFVLSELHGHVQDAFNEAGLQILSPHFETQPAEKVWVPKDRWEGAPGAGRPSGSSQTPRTERPD